MEDDSVLGELTVVGDDSDVVSSVTEMSPNGNWS